MPSKHIQKCHWMWEKSSLGVIPEAEVITYVCSITTVIWTAVLCLECVISKLVHIWLNATLWQHDDLTAQICSWEQSGCELSSRFKVWQWRWITISIFRIFSWRSRCSSCLRALLAWCSLLQWWQRANVLIPTRLLESVHGSVSDSSQCCFSSLSWCMSH